MRSGNQLIFKISYLTIGSLFCLTLYFTYSSYALHLKFKTEDKLNHLAAIVNTAATFVDGDAYEQLLQNQKANPEKIENNLLYKKLHHQLQDIYERSQLESPIYFLTYDESAQQFIYGPTSSSVSYFGKSYTQFPEILMERYTEGAVINRYDTENGQWLSAFSPIRNSKGEVVAVLQADSPFCSFWSKALQDLFFNTLLSLMVVLLLAFTLRKYMKRMIQLSSEKELAEEKAEIKSKFLSTMSHEIRTPMNAVIGLTNILLDESPREDQKKNLKTLKFSADLLLTLINDILDYSKLEAGEINLEEINYDLHQLIYNIMDSFRLTAEKKQLPLEIYIDEKVPTHVIGDPVRLSQILTNLVGNAIKFTEQGKVAVHLTMMDQKGERANIRFEVIDTGIGIPEDKFEAIFESFTQADLTTTRKFGGTGLG
ncbi:MAG TPA: hypothetical protein ENJ45_06285, partial [Phaeodactylibacter sp.]|nr:hypothetical protein [Phaeodactylibacter sp.]